VQSDLGPIPAPTTSRAPLARLASDSTARPLLKWAGGKRQLLPRFRRFYPASFNSYFEPFLGSGAVFFDLHASGRLDGHPVVLTDRNPDLIGCYRAVGRNPVAVVRALDRLAHAHKMQGSALFYSIRERFNRRRARGALEAIEYTPELAAMLIYLNRTGFNGLFRLNAEGRFNVPAGRYARPRISDPPHIHRVAQALGHTNVRLELAGFEAVLDRARPGDFLYFDPPYAPLSATARFTAYTANPFTLDDHARLRDVVVALAARGCHVMVSNSDAPAVAALYEQEPCVAASGLRVHRLRARRAINSRASARGPVTEILLTNLQPSPAVSDP
jgi:DNA adenine methylase